MGQEQSAIDAWYHHWVIAGFEALEELLIAPQPYACGRRVTLADICLVPQVYNARRLKVPLDKFPKNRRRRYGLPALAAFDRARPGKPARRRVIDSPTDTLHVHTLVTIAGLDPPPWAEPVSGSRMIQNYARSAGRSLCDAVLGAGLCAVRHLSGSVAGARRLRLQPRQIRLRPISSRRLVKSGLRFAPRRPARRLRPRRRGPCPRRSDQARRGRHRQAAGRPRPRGRAGTQGRLRRRGIFRAVLGAVAAMRADHLADSADARQSRPHDERSPAAAKRQCQPGRPTPRADRTAGAE